MISPASTSPRATASRIRSKRSSTASAGSPPEQPQQQERRRLPARDRQTPGDRVSERDRLTRDDERPDTVTERGAAPEHRVARRRRHRADRELRQVEPSLGGRAVQLLDVEQHRPHAERRVDEAVHERVEREGVVRARREAEGQLAHRTEKGNVSPHDSRRALHPPGAPAGPARRRPRRLVLRPGRAEGAGGRRGSRPAGAARGRRCRAARGPRGRLAARLRAGARDVRARRRGRADLLLRRGRALLRRAAAADRREPCTRSPTQRLDELLPGEGSLAERRDAWREQRPRRPPTS